jgi:hypothetical protein
MKFLVWADRDSDKLDLIRESAALCGMELKLIGLGRDAGDLYNNLFKQESLYEAACEIEDDEIVCATDGYDVFYQSGPETIREKFLSFDCDVVFSAERMYSHQYRSFKGYFDDATGSSPYRYLNAGGVVGYAGALRRLYRPGVLLRLKVASLQYHRLHRLAKKVTSAVHAIIPPKQRGGGLAVQCLGWYDYADQAIMAKYVAKNTRQLAIELDRECSIFWCTASEWEDIDSHYEIIDAKMVSKHTGQIPACIHVPWEKKYRHVLLKLWEISRKSIG